MRRPYSLVLAMLIASVCMMEASGQIFPTFGGDRSGTSGFQFLKIPVDARGAAMGHTVGATATDASSLFWNPALASQSQGMQLGFSHTEYFADVRLEYIAFIYPLSRGGVSLGASVQTLNSGDMNVTTEFQPFGTGETFALSDLAASLTFSQRLTDLFSYGLTAKYVQESVAGISTETVVLDLGIFYRVGGTGAQMGVSIRNFGLDASPSGELERTVIGESIGVVETDFESMTPPTTFLLSVAYDVFQNRPSSDLSVSVQLSNPNDNVESWNVGAEYIWNGTLILRSGYRFGIEEYTTPSAGVGLMIPGLGPDIRFDYGFSRLERLGSIHRIGINVGL
ncbi:MAG: PorV/PorQ family protein [Rhodothermales bacterium]|nr:PorV/PorQ family protein [Rhodothermales bacterium]